MRITALTCTADRPEALALCHRWMERQTRQPDQWLILDDPHIPMPQKVLYAVASGAVKGDGLIFVEDDDVFFPGWLAWCEKQLNKFDLVGQGYAIYYHVGRRWWSECRNVRHASLCQTAITSDLFEPLCNTIKAFDSPFFDTRIWMLECAKYLHLPKTDAERLVIGMKGLPGKVGYSDVHDQKVPPGVHSDPALVKLWKLIGRDALLYGKFKT